MLWIGPEISPYEALSMASFVKAGFQVNLYSYEKNLSVPAGVILRDARSVLTIEDVYSDGNLQPPYALFSDYFRFKLLLTLETTWVDCDVVLIGADLPSGPYLFGAQETGTYNTAILRAPKNSNLIHRLYSNSFEISPNSWTWGQTGPSLLSSVVAELELDYMALGRKQLYPVRFQNAWSLFNPKHKKVMCQETAHAHTVHLWNEVLSRGMKNFKQLAPPKDSFMADLFERFEVEVEHLPKMNKVKVIWLGLQNSNPVIRRAYNIAKRFNRN